MTRVAIRRVLTASPLARQYDRLLDGRARKKVAIPWARFQPGKYPAPALALAGHAQRMLATGEYGAIGLFARLTSALALNGVPLDLVAASSVISSDELRHADYAMRMAALCGDEGGVELDREVAVAEWSRPMSLEELDHTMIRLSAISETLALAMLAACEERATDPVAHALFSSIVGDEVHHARLGWYYLAWRAPQWTQAERQRSADWAASIIIDVERRFSVGRDAPAGAKQAAKALGVLDTPSLRKAIRDVMEDEIVPGLDALGLGASVAWRARRRAK